MEQNDCPRSSINADKFECLIRYLVVAAREWRLVSYTELQEFTGLNFESMGTYLGFVGDFCLAHNWGKLPAIVISAECLPSDGYLVWRQRNSLPDHGEKVENWGWDLSEALRKYYSHDNSYFLTKLGEKIREFLNP